MDRFKVSFILEGANLDGSDVLDCLEDFIAAETAARLDCFFLEGSPCVESIVMNDDERRQWVENDEELYTRWRRSGVGLYTWTRTHREEIDEVIEIVMGRRAK